jgi:hypothetical protein
MLVIIFTMPPHPVLRVRTPPSDDDPKPTPHYKNILLMLTIGTLLHFIAYVVTKDEIFFYIGMLFSALTILTLSCLNRYN